MKSFHNNLALETKQKKADMAALSKRNSRRAKMCKICQNRDGNNSRHAIDEFLVASVHT